MALDGPRHLLHVFPSFSIGGSQMRLATLIEALGADYRHTIVSLNGAWGAKSLLGANANVRFVEAPSQAGSILRRVFTAASFVRGLRPDLLLTYNFGAIEYALANALVRAPHLHFEDGFGPDEAQRLKPRRGVIRRLALFHSDIVAPSRKLEKIALETWGFDRKKIHYLPNGVSAHEGEGLALEGFGLPPRTEAVRIAWAGAFRPEKNPVRLIRAFAKTRSRSVLLFIGDGPEREAMEREIERAGLRERVFFTGYRNDVRDLIASCDIVSLSSDTEQMPYLVLEAMDAGLAVASVDVGDVKTMVSGVNAPFITPLDEEALAAALDRLCEDRDLREQVGTENRVRVRSLFSVEGMAVAYRELFEAMLSGAD